MPSAGLVLLMAAGVAPSLSAAFAPAAAIRGGPVAAAARRSHSAHARTLGTPSLAGRSRRPAKPALLCTSDTIRTPGSIADMMNDAAAGAAAAVADDERRVVVEIPLPITGGTELDDWPGGIGQKYETLRQMVPGMLKTLGFSAEQIATRVFLGYEEDAIGVWTRTLEDGQQLSVVAFATPEVLAELQELGSKGTLVLINHQFFLDQFSRQETKDFLASFEIAYFLQSLNMKGPGLLPIKGVLRRTYPGDWVVGRRMDAGVFEVLKTAASRPAQDEITELFFKDSEIRDKDLSLFDRLKRLGAEATNI